MTIYCKNFKRRKWYFLSTINLVKLPFFLLLALVTLLYLKRICNKPCFSILMLKVTNNHFRNKLEIAVQQLSNHIEVFCLKLRFANLVKFLKRLITEKFWLFFSVCTIKNNAKGLTFFSVFFWWWTLGLIIDIISLLSFSISWFFVFSLNSN